MARPPKWFPAATRIPGNYPGQMDGTGGTRKLILHTEAPPLPGGNRGPHGRDGNALWLARYTVARNIAYHLVYDYSGRFAQCYPADAGARALEAPGRWSPNRQGDLAVQICFAGITDASELAHWPMTNWQRFLDWLDDLGIPQRTHIDWAHPTRSESDWRKSGWTCHAAAPMNRHTDGARAPIRHLWHPPGGRDDRRRWRVAATTRTGSRRIVHLDSLGRFRWRNTRGDRTLFTPGEARKARQWAKKRRAADIDVVPDNGWTHLQLAPGARWPTDRRLLAALNTVGRRRRRRIWIVSGRRTLSQQRKLWEAWIAYRDGRGPKANLAAYPNPQAPHIRGVAADCGVLDRKGRYRSLGLDARARRIAEELGLAALVPGEPWHWQRRDTY